jgi:short-subunit dehydrogenase
VDDSPEKLDLSLMNSTTPRPLAVITGASEGIGRDLATCYALANFDLVLVARRQALLDELAGHLFATYGSRAQVVVADLATSEGCERVLEAVAPQRERLFALVNNAGFGTHGWFHEVPLERQRALIEVNISALTHLSWGMLPWLRANGRGHVMNVASVAAFQPGPLMATYYASKAYVLSLSEALHNECLGTGVTVTAVCPGPTQTGFKVAAGLASDSAPGGPPPMNSAEVADLGFRGTMAGKPVVVTGARNVVAAALGRYFPRAWSAAAVRRIQLARMRARR